MKLRKSSIQFKFAPALLIILALGSFALCQSVHAVVPPPDGGYPGFNTAEGQNALFNLTTGSLNTAVGWSSLFSDAEGSLNTATGAGALLFNTGDQNTAFGAAALLLNTTAEHNTAIGAAALLNNTTGIVNTATGAFALSSNTIGGANTAIGDSALSSNSAGNGNTATGQFALAFNDVGSSNTAMGNAALSNNTTGFNNTALGAGAGTNVTTAGGVLCLGHIGGNVSNTTWISGVAGITPQSFTTAPVIVSDGGQLGTVVSSERFKKDIASMDKTSEAILSLRPVTFHYKTDTNSTRQFGLIAEEVGKVNPALVLTDKDGKPYTVRYDAVNAMLLNEFLKEHKKVEGQQRKIEKQEATIARLKAEFQSNLAEQKKQMQALTSGLQKVSAEVQMGKPAPRVVLNKH
jgi:hypothetical protein